MSAPDFDVLVVGAGLSGIGAGYRLQTECPDKRFAIFEGRESIGGTWDLFRYPGVRSDSDMFTLGYAFNPYTGKKVIASGSSILEYIRGTAKKFGIDKKVRFQHRIVSAAWSSAKGEWTVDVEIGQERARKTYRTKFLYMCCGYYAYDAAHAPELKDVGKFQGKIVHPQWWPEDLKYEGKKVVVIGSGATAVTIVPSMAEKAAHVTMLQRSPTYITSLPDEDKIAQVLQKTLPESTAYQVIRMKNVLLTLGMYQFCRRFPKQARAIIEKQARRHLPAEFALDPHLTPKYAPWDQRLCLIPNGDLFKSIKKGKASIVTAAIDRFTETGIKLTSGEELEADIVVTATGLKILAFGNIKLSVDGKPIHAKDALVYKGLMLSGVPNLAWCVGYINASWTLRADLASRYVCRLLNYMEKKKVDRATPYVEPGDESALRPLLDVSSGYVQRALDQMPKQGSKAPWYIR
ncbi:MAG: NAD(P)/FAD-dependent oxidoreductase, partial [Polyangiaceae bacterium]